MIALHKSDLFQAAVSLLYPATCTICGKNVRAGEYLCDECDGNLIRIVAPFCQTCSEPFEGSIQSAFTCANCAHRTIYFDAAVAAYRLRNSADVRGLRVLLIDDVLTAGSTLSECARVLKRAGAISVHAATAARA